MTERHVSLLRGINVGGHNLVSMARLRDLYEALGCEDVTTYLQTIPTGSAPAGSPGCSPNGASGSSRPPETGGP